MSAIIILSLVNLANCNLDWIPSRNLGHEDRCLVIMSEQKDIGGQLTGQSQKGFVLAGLDEQEEEELHVQQVVDVEHEIFAGTAIQTMLTGCKLNGDERKVLVLEMKLAVAERKMK